MVIVYPALEAQVFHNRETAVMTCFPNIDKEAQMSKALELGGVDFSIPLLHIKELGDACKLCLQKRTQG